MVLSTNVHDTGALDRLVAAYGETAGDETVERGDAPPAIRAVDELHDAAVRAGASDIHVEPTDEGGRVRQRVDGLLREMHTVPASLFAQIISRIKLLAAMDIADRRQPQDGRYSITLHGRSIDARVSSMPTIAGEKLVVRLLDMHARVPSLELLGMPPELLRHYRRLIHAPYGFVVICGPTGSGKTTTLYASIDERNVEGEHVCTVEDPVEVRMPGVAQVQVHARAGVTFAAALRSFLRQDPNVIMIGEMRDGETAGVAMSAALSGQLVMTSLHANDAPRTVDRLVELGLERHALAAGLSGIVAQRLVRQLCDHCKRRARITDADARLLRLESGQFAYEAGGCEKCNGTGYRGRLGIFEFFPVTTAVRTAIANEESSVAIAEAARATGYEPMIVHGMRRMQRGETSVEELRRVLGFAI
ncbi:MAG TPA: GspE/PulE family protein [Candidatus Baltobacteraceae bacterium]|nr:GspE/PulE family protein [Candidatus Baltobacteraceae bacterium]